MRGRKRTLQAKRTEQVVKNKVRGKLRKDKAKNTAKHGAVRGDRGMGERQGTAKIEKLVSNLGHHGTRHRMATPMTPGTVYYPLGQKGATNVSSRPLEIRIFANTRGRRLNGGKAYACRPSQDCNIASVPADIWSYIGEKYTGR